MTAIDHIRALCAGLIEEANHLEDAIGAAGAHDEITARRVCEEVLHLVDGGEPRMFAITHDTPLPATDVSRIPPTIRKTLDDYRDHHLQPGAGLRYVLGNDLASALMFCDAPTCAAMPAILSYLSTFPRGSWGSPDAVARWLSRAVA